MPGTGNMFSLEGKVAVITGGSRGIGRSIALGFAETGADVVIASRDMGRASAVTDEITAMGRRSAAFSFDAAKVPSIERLAERVSREFGRVDVLVNSAGAHVKTDSFDMTPEEWDLVMDTNLKGMFFSCRSFGKLMMDNGGSIINISSINGFTPFPGTLAYCVSKSGALMLTKSLATDWARYGIRVNAIAPGVIPTDLNRKALEARGRVEAIVSRTPMGRLGTTGEVVGAALYLASDASRFVTGETITVDGGFLAKGI